MGSITYYEAVKGNLNAFGLRVKLVDFALEHGIKPAAREFACNIKTARKWLGRYKKLGLAGLKDQSKQPKNSPNKTPPEEEAAIKALRASLKKVSPRRMKREFGIKRAESTIYRIIKSDPDYKRMISGRLKPNLRSSRKFR